MSEIGNYITAVRMMSRAAFMQQNPNPFLLVKLEDSSTPEPKPQPADDDWAGTTRMTRVVGKTGSFAVLRHNAALYRVHKMRVTDPSAVAEHPDVTQSEIKCIVTLGRTPDNDIVIAEQAVSKYHARFTTNFRGDWLLTDCGSRNGTSVNGRRLAPNEPTPVNFGDPISLGGLALMIIGAGALYEMVAAQLPPKE